MSSHRPPLPPALRLPADPGALYRLHRAEIDAAVARVLESGRYLMGEETAAFEREFAAYHNLADCVTTGSGTEALELALRALDVGPGDAVVTVSHTAVATVAAIEAAGAEAVLVDVDPVTFTMSPEHLRETLASRAGRRARAVVPVHLYGHPAQMDAILEIAGESGLAVVEDCAQAHGAEWRGLKVGTFGAFGAFSFYPTKNLGALGDGGALVTADPALADRARLLKQYGWRERYISDLPGINTRLDELQAAVLRVKLPHLDAQNGRRRELAEGYRTGLAGSEVRTPVESPGARHVYHQFVVRTEQRDALQAHLAGLGVGCAVHYPLPVHLQPAYRGRVRTGPSGLPHTERLCREILSLPLQPTLTDEEIGLVARMITDWCDPQEVL